mgnify:CR=1 FL=1
MGDEPPIQTDVSDALLSNLPGMVYRCRNEPDWTMLYASNGCLQLTECTREDLVDNQVVSYGSLIHPGDRKRVWEEVQKSLATGRPYELNVTELGYS